MDWTVKAQPTVRGFNAYALSELVRIRGVSTAEVAAWIIDRWIDDQLPMLGERYGISLKDFEKINQGTESVE